MTNPLRKVEHHVERMIRLNRYQYVEVGRGRCKHCGMPEGRRWQAFRWEGEMPRRDCVYAARWLCALCVIQGHR